jgi:hypothetical protein
MPTVTAGTGGLNVEVEIDLGGAWGAYYNESQAFMNLPNPAKDEAKIYLQRVSEGVKTKNVPSTRAALNKLADLYDTQAGLAGITSTQGQQLQQLAKNCRQAAKTINERNIDQLNQNRGGIKGIEKEGDGAQNNDGNNSNSSNSELAKALANREGQVDLDSAEPELKLAGYTQEEIDSFKTFCQDSGIAKVQDLTTGNNVQNVQAQP